MAIVGAKEITAVEDELFPWFHETLDWLTEQMTTDGYPYGSTPVTDEELLAEYLSMDDAALGQYRLQLQSDLGPKAGEAAFQQYMKDVERAAATVERRHREMVR